MCDFLEGVAPNGARKYKSPPSPHKSPECVVLCGIDSVVGGLSGSHRLPNCREKGNFTCFLALK
jgi:hypothetical protein